MRRLLILLLLAGLGLIHIPRKISAQTTLPTCPADEMICMVETSWTVAELPESVETLEPGTGIVIQQNDYVVFAYRTPNDKYNRVTATLLSLGYEAPMQRIEESGWWTLTLEFDAADDAFLSFGVIEQHGGSTSYKLFIASWGGVNTPQLPAFNNPLVGSYEQLRFRSEALDATRTIDLYLPPDHDPSRSYPVIYVLDGETLSLFTGGIDYLIMSGEIPPLIMVGVPSGSAEIRGEEYVPGRNPERFAAYVRFLNEELSPWVQENYGASIQREDEILFGVSNGGLFAAAMTMRHPESYGTVFIFSAGASRDFAGLELERENLQLPLRVYSTAGTLETRFHSTTSELASAYQAIGADVVFTEHLAGHDYAMWVAEFFKAVAWAFSE